jgi:hypothetical protein
MDPAIVQGVLVAALFAGLIYICWLHSCISDYYYEVRRSTYRLNALSVSLDDLTKDIETLKAPKLPTAQITQTTIAAKPDPDPAARVILRLTPNQQPSDWSI